MRSTMSDEYLTYNFEHFEIVEVSEELDIISLET